jgi:hypothetical protein
MDNPAARHWGIAPLFDPREGTTIVDPPGQGNGYWAGAPGASYDPDTKHFYLYYRLRVPRELGRGIECRIAESADGTHFETIWSARKQEFPTDSMERASLVKRPGGGWLLYPSYVDAETSKWRIDVVEAAHPAEFKLSERQKVFVAEDIGAEGVKDPYVAVFGGLYYMVASYATSPRGDFTEAEKHGSADIYNTGKTTSSTGIAVSGDGLSWRWLGDCFSPRAGSDVWDAYAARIGTLIYLPPVWTAFYDGSASVAENYEERTGIAISLDLHHFHRVTSDRPILTSAHASGSLRYMDALQFEDEIYYYYEYARADGSHELRLNRVRI